MPALVVADTSALLMPFERRVRIEPELERLLGTYEILVPEACRRELHRIASQERGARRDRARLAHQWSARFRAVAGQQPADEECLRVAKENAAYLLTNDSDLIRRAHEVQVRAIRLKGLSHLAMDPPDGS